MTNILKSEDGLTLEVALPGVDKSAVSLKIKERNLIISVKNDSGENEQEKINYLRREFRSRDWSRTFRVGKEINLDGIKAEMENGVLEVTLPKVEVNDEKRTVTIQ